MTFVAAIAGYLVGSIPTAGFLGRLWGVDLRSEGSGNPGTKNALSTAGPTLAASVLLVEAAKGYAAVSLGWWLGGEQGAIVAGIGAVAGNVFNMWYRFEGGKGLAISLGVLARAWPLVIPVLVAIIVGAVLITRSAGLAALTTMAGLIISAVAWSANGWPTGGVATGPGLIALALAMTALMAWKHWRDSPLNPAWRSARRAPESQGRR